ncbi:MAG: DUF4215 domain-containing protein [Polyangiaceae bacterium]
MSMASFTVACDDTGDGTSSTGTPGIVCGDGVKEAGEACDDGNRDNGDGCSATCQTETVGECGDGTTNIGEQCDDGNMVSGDGCSMTCMTETAAMCGNGKKEGAEQCDDGNTTPGDGCSATCTNEGMMICGDGVPDPGEQCDDGNKIPLDGCENDCTTSPGEVVCPALTPTANLCEVTPGDATKLISGDVLGPATIYRGGSVALNAMGQITCVGCDCAAANPTATKIVCAEAVISPGLINTHDHIGWANEAPYTDTGERYEQRHDWRKGLNGHTKITSAGGASTTQKAWGELRFLMSGATSLVGSGSATGFLRNLDGSAQEGLGVDPVDFDTFPLGDSNGTQLATGCGYPGINTTSAIAADSAYFPHIAEGIDAFAHNEFDCVDDDRMMHDLIQPQSAFIHAVGLTPSDYAQMAGGGTSLIWSPRSNVTLYGDTAQVTVAKRMGVNIALGTDWVVSGSMNMQRELTCASELNATYYDHVFSDGDLFRMVTLNAAKAIHAETAIGSLAEGLTGDIAIYDARVHTDYRAIIDGEPKDVALVLRGGKPIYGDANVISGVAGGAMCDAVTVCGNAKSVCAMSEVGQTYDALKAATPKYEAFYCGKPPKEPSCVPTRPVAKNMSTVYTGAITAADSDGDGIPNAMDNCPTVFNPIRPMDNGMQANADGDADGDACDPCPLNPDTTTCMVVVGDADGDGVPNTTDNCPNVANMNQADADMDGKGDVCDACPNYKNPGSDACVTTIYKIKDGTQALGPVALVNQLVTGCVPSKGYFLQVKPGDADYDMNQGVQNSGIFVFDAMTNCSALKVGDRIDITNATAANFFGQIQLSGAAATVKTSANETLPTPVVLTPAVAGGTMANTYEAVLARVDNVTVTDVMPAPGTGDVAPTNEFVVGGALRVNDFMYLVTPFPTVGSIYSSITGILDYKNNNMKLEPRSAADFALGAPVLQGFSTANTFIRVNKTAAPTIPVPLEVEMTSPVAMNTDIAVTSSDPATLAVVGGKVTILAGTSHTQVLLTSAATASPGVTLTAGGFMSSVRVVGDSEVPVLQTVTPPSATINPGGMATFSAILDIPAPPGGANVSLVVSPPNGGTTSPANFLLIPADQLAGTFTFVDAATAPMPAVTVSYNGTKIVDIVVNSSSCSATNMLISEIRSRGPGGASDEFVELYNPTNAAITLDNSWTMEGRSHTAATYMPRWTGTGKVVPAHGHLLIGGSAYAQMPTADDSLSTGITDATSLVLKHSGVVVDAVCYAFDAASAMPFTAAGNTYVCEGAPFASNPHNNATSTNIDGSIERAPGGDLGNCTDSQVSADDFGALMTAAPQNTSSMPKP